MGWFSKEEKYNPETGRFEVVEKPSLFSRKPREQEVKELTREEQIEPQRRHPWETPRGKQFIKTMGRGVKKLDQKIVRYNRKYNPHRSGGNFNPWGSTFDKGMQPMNVGFGSRIKSKSKPKSKKTKYAVVGGKAYPIAGTSGKRKKKTKKAKSKRFDAFSFDFGRW